MHVKVLKYINKYAIERKCYCKIMRIGFLWLKKTIAYWTMHGMDDVTPDNDGRLATLTVKHF